MSSQTYDPQKVIISVGDVTVTGFAKGTFVKVSREEDGFSKVVGADGQVSRTRNANRSGSIEITLKASAASNDLLSAYAAADELAGTGVKPVQIKDGSGTTVCSAANAWIKKIPDVERGKEETEVTWALDCDVLNISVGGTSVL